MTVKTIAKIGAELTSNLAISRCYNKRLTHSRLKNAGLNVAQQCETGNTGKISDLFKAVKSVANILDFTLPSESAHRQGRHFSDLFHFTLPKYPEPIEHPKEPDEIRFSLIRFPTFLLFLNMRLIIGAILFSISRFD